MTDILLSHCQGRSLSQWLSYLETIHNTEIDLGLTRIKHVGERLNIDLSFAKVITVAGTNGKGTTCAFLENALLAENHSVAVYSSPHIEKFNERLRINKIDIDDQALISAFEKIENIRGEISLTYYEYTTLAALLILMVLTPEFIILEVGLGGRLDATNMIDADISVITTIDLDHQSFLGNDRESIGFEKAGILRTKKRAVLGDLKPTHSILSHAQNINANLFVREQHFTLQNNALIDGENQTWQWQSNNIVLDRLQAPKIPKDNVATALMVLSLLDMPLSNVKVNKLIEQTSVAGRTEMFHAHCDVLLDVAHNPQAARYLAQYVQTQQQQHHYNKIIAVIGMLSDKDINNTLLAMNDLVDFWYMGGLTIPRAASAELLAEKLMQISEENTDKFNCFDNVSQAYKIACENSQANDLIVVFGSFYTVADVRRLLT